MRLLYQDPYKELARWDMISRFRSVSSSHTIPNYEALRLRMHEDHPKHYRDRHVQSFVLELITGQRVSPLMVSKGRYKKYLVVKKPLKSSQVQVTLRNNKLLQFLLRWSSLTVPSAQYFRGLGKPDTDKNGNMSFYYPDTLSFLELLQLNIFIYSCNALQFHVSHNKFTNSLQAQYLLSVFHVPLLKETFVDPYADLPSLSFFKK